MTTKVCSKCGEEKDIDEFSNNKSRRDGKLEQCKECARMYQIELRKTIKLNNLTNPPEHPEKIKCSCCKQEKSTSEFYSDFSRKLGVSNKCKECSKILGKSRYEKTSEYVKQRQREYNLINKDKIREYNKNRAKKPIKPRSEYNYNCPPHQKRIIAECNKNRIWSEESKNKIREKLIGRKPSEESRRKMGDSRRGEKNPRWNGGSSFEPYCVKFNKEFKERVRKFFNYTCVECGMSESENGRNLCVHHVNYDKEACCNKNNPLFVTLCTSCHTKTNNKRENWEKHFTEIINSTYGGKCYLPKVS